MSEDPYAQKPNPHEGDPSGTPPLHEPGREESSQGGFSRPLSDTLRQLPAQYLRVLTKPGAQTFAAEIGKASWDIVMMQVMICAAFIAVFIYSQLFLGTSGPLRAGFEYGGILMNGFGMGDVVTLFVLSAMTLGFLWVAFFVNAGMTFLAAKWLGGEGRFLEHCYATALWMMPLLMVNIALSSMPIIGGLVSASGWAFTIYGLILNAFGVMAVHRLSGGRAALAVILPIVALIALGSALTFGVMAATAPPGPELAPVTSPASAPTYYHSSGGCGR